MYYPTLTTAKLLFDSLDVSLRSIQSKDHNLPELSKSENPSESLDSYIMPSGQFGLSFHIIIKNENMVSQDKQGQIIQLRSRRDSFLFMLGSKLYGCSSTNFSRSPLRVKLYVIGIFWQFYCSFRERASYLELPFLSISIFSFQRLLLVTYIRNIYLNQL